MLSVDEIEEKCIVYEKALKMSGGNQVLPVPRGASSGAKDKEVSPPPPPPPPGPVEVLPTAAVTK